VELATAAAKPTPEHFEVNFKKRKLADLGKCFTGFNPTKQTEKVTQ
jgi:hypothetical protein